MRAFAKEAVHDLTEQLQAAPGEAGFIDMKPDFGSQEWRGAVHAQHCGFRVESTNRRDDCPAFGGVADCLGRHQLAKRTCRKRQVVERQQGIELPAAPRAAGRPGQHLSALAAAYIDGSDGAGQPGLCAVEGDTPSVAGRRVVGTAYDPTQVLRPADMDSIDAEDFQFRRNRDQVFALAPIDVYRCGGNTFQASASRPAGAQVAGLQRFKEPRLRCRQLQGATSDALKRGKIQAHDIEARGEAEIFAQQRQSRMGARSPRKQGISRVKAN